MRARFALTFFGLCLALGCTSTPAGNDAAMSGNDAGNDAATASGNDAGTDGATVADTGADAGSTEDASSGVCADTFAGCTAATTVDHTADSTVTISAVGFAYDHPCIRITAGTMVTIENSALHPVVGATCSTAGGPLPTIGTPATLPATTSTFTFAAAGNYGFHCANHGTDTGTGMAGLIIVQ